MATDFGMTMCSDGQLDNNGLGTVKQDQGLTCRNLETGHGEILVLFEREVKGLNCPLYLASYARFDNKHPFLS